MPKNKGNAVWTRGYGLARLGFPGPARGLRINPGPSDLPAFPPCLPGAGRAACDSELREEGKLLVLPSLITLGWSRRHFCGASLERMWALAPDSRQVMAAR